MAPIQNTSFMGPSSKILAALGVGDGQKDEAGGESQEE